MTDPHSIATDLGLTIALDGVQLIEASAGTGKTFTLATLYTRLIIEQGLPVSSILAVTFTEAATKELRTRCRDRLVLALHVLEHPNDSTASQTTTEERLTRHLITHASEREGRVPLSLRLRAQVAAMDLAPIYTIHSFCRRALADHALEAGQSLVECALIENETLLHEEVATDFWREASRHPRDASTLLALWSSPTSLAKALRDLLSPDVMLPEPTQDDGRGEATLIACRIALADTFSNDGAAARDALRLAAELKSVHASIVKNEAVDPVWHALTEWLPHPDHEDPASDKLGNYSQANLETKTNKNGITPTSPLFEAIGRWQEACNTMARIEQQRQIAMVHRVRHFARERLTQIKQQRNLFGFDDMIRDVAQALIAPTGDNFAQQLQAQYQVALVDEFQDTDTRQWSIFRRLFASPTEGIKIGKQTRALILIGDPKQAIYRFRGGDVFTYLEAAASATARHDLTHNFRSRPAVLASVQALFELSGRDPFAQPNIHFTPVQSGAGCRDDHWTIDGVAAPALNVLALPEPPEIDGKRVRDNIGDSRDYATQACVTAIHGLLCGTARIGQGDDARRVSPGDIAVLVETHNNGDLIHAALTRAGIPCVIAGRSSVYASDEAEDLRRLFQALMAPADEGRFRAALATNLLGDNARDIAALDDDDSTHRHRQDTFLVWRQRAERHGPMALIGDLCAEQASRILAMSNGERRLTNYLQLAEDLQSTATHALGLSGILDALEQRMLSVDNSNESELLRLESDAERVKILTLHKSKGLEFNLVFLPYTATSGSSRASGKPDMAKFHDGSQRVALLFPKDSPAALAKEAEEERAEKLRLLYVGLTRARLATWIAWGITKEVEKTAMAWLLHRDTSSGTVPTLDPLQINSQLTQLCRKALSLSPTDSHPLEPVALISQSADHTLTPYQHVVDTVASATAKIATRAFSRDWWVYSFSQLSRDETGIDSRGSSDEIEPVPDLVSSPFVGAPFGNALHAALENIQFSLWRDWTHALPPPGQLEPVSKALHDAGFTTENDNLEGLPLLTKLISNTLNVRLPEGTRLSMLPDAARCAEMEFHLSLTAIAIPALINCLHKFCIVPDRQAFGFRQRIQGLLTGFIDLIYEFDDRFFVLDYKSNLLPEYSEAALLASVREHEYDLQYTIYTLALHRWLRFRMGEHYDYDRHVGGIRYVFCRGIDASHSASSGIHALTLPRALIESLDALFSQAGASS